MDSFLDRLYPLVREKLDDPSFSVRLTNTAILRAFDNVEKTIWERMLSGSVDSVIGYVETPITLTEDQNRYALPGNFRQFLGLEYRDTGDDSIVIARRGSIHRNEFGPGVVITEPGRELIWKPMPISGETGIIWTLMYQKGPIIIHEGTAQAVGATSITFEATPSAGELIGINDYYNGSMIRILDGNGITETAEITDYVSSTKVATVRRWSGGITPSGTPKYEIRPLIPPDYDELYALDIAIKQTSNRRGGRGLNELLLQRTELFNGARNVFMSAVADRAPSRNIPVVAEVDPYEVY